jgi:hypothetical protein
MASQAMGKIVSPDTLRSVLALVGTAFHKVLGLITAG